MIDDGPDSDCHWLWRFNYFNFNSIFQSWISESWSIQGVVIILKQFYDAMKWWLWLWSDTVIALTSHRSQSTVQFPCQAYWPWRITKLTLLPLWLSLTSSRRGTWPFSRCQQLWWLLYLKWTKVRLRQPVALLIDLMTTTRLTSYGIRHLFLTGLRATAACILHFIWSCQVCCCILWRVRASGCNVLWCWRTTAAATSVPDDFAWMKLHFLWAASRSQQSN